MKTFTNAVAVITGGASGIGLACAEEAVERGMKVVLGDIREEPLAEVQKRFTDAGADVVSIVTDVTKEEDIKRLGQLAKDSFGKTNLLINNAGIFAAGLAWETSAEEYEWGIRTNIMSVLNGIRLFVPDMISSGEDCHVVNIASGAGLICSPGFTLYSLTKHAVVAITESMHYDFLSHGVTNVGTTVVMPGYIQSDVMNPDKVAPTESLSQELGRRLEDPVFAAVEGAMRQGVSEGMPARQAAKLIFAAVENGHTYLRPNFEPNMEFARATAAARLDGTMAPQPLL